jgi:hypothetical protein
MTQYLCRIIVYERLLFPASLSINHMQKLIAIFFLLNFSCSYPQEYLPAESLYPVVEKERWGYMNRQGQIIIKPRFEQAGNFSEGLATVRTNGQYGYINTSGKIVIKQSLDFAYAFRNGYALVYKNSIPQIIRKNGQPVFKNMYPELTMVNENRFIVTTAGQAKGIVDARGKLIVDTLFTEITATENNLYTVRGVKNKVSNYSDDAGVIDDTGNFIIPYGIYRFIWPYKNGLAKIEVQTPEKGWDYNGFIDTKGSLVIRITDKKIFKAEDFNGQFCKVSLLAKETNYSRDDYYEGFMDRTGNLVVNDQTFSHVFGFTNNRAFALTRDSGIFLLDRSGKPMSNISYHNIRVEGFADGKAFVSTKDGWQVIDTNANVLMKQDVVFEDATYLTNALFYSLRRKWGFWDLEKNNAPKIRFDYYDPSGFTDGLLLIQDDQRLSYVDRSGKKIWEQKEVNSNKLKPLNIDYMKRGYYYAYSSPLKDEFYNGWAKSGNLPRQNASYEWIEKGKLDLHLSDEDTIVNGNTQAKKLFIVNTTFDTAFFPAQNSRLYLTIQAFDPEQGWKDIEYLPSSWCGNSYHTLRLAPQEYWTFATPVYEGGVRTKLRAALRLYKTGKPNRRDDESITIYSSEFEGGINPAQFWRKLDYHPGGLMDPYND